MQGGAVRLEAGVALPVKALKVGQEDYWLDQIARDREEYFIAVCPDRKGNTRRPECCC
jgi:hypothetical protein